MQPQQTNQTKWWEAEGRDAAMRAVAMISQINTAQIGFHQDNLRHLRMYENRDYLAAAVSSYMVKTYAPTRRTGGNRTSNRMALNVLQGLHRYPCIEAGQRKGQANLSHQRRAYRASFPCPKAE